MTESNSSFYTATVIAGDSTGTLKGKGNEMKLLYLI